MSTLTAPIEMYKACELIANPLRQMDAYFDDGNIRVQEMPSMHNGYKYFNYEIPALRSPKCKCLQIKPHKFKIGRNASPLVGLVEFARPDDHVVAYYEIETYDFFFQGVDQRKTSWSCDIVLEFRLMRNGLTVMASSCLLTSSVVEMSNK